MASARTQWTRTLRHDLVVVEAAADAEDATAGRRVLECQVHAGAVVQPVRRIQRHLRARRSASHTKHRTQVSTSVRADIIVQLTGRVAAWLKAHHPVRYVSGFTETAWPGAHSGVTPRES